MGTLLSICIPTFNRAGLLRETLDSILPQDREGLEIVISDNASPDTTREVIDEYQKRFSHLTYFRWSENMGPDRNFLKTVEIAGGDFCWFLGDDDQLEAGTLDTIFPLLTMGYDLMYINAMTYDSKMQNPSGRTVNNFACHDANETLLSLSSWVTFASSLCFSRAKFINYLDLGMAKIGTNLVQCYPVLKLIKEGKSHIVEEPLVRFRAGNTSGYGIFQVFIAEFGRLMAFCSEIGFSPEVVRQVKRRNVYQVIVPALVQIKLGKLNLKAESVVRYLADSGLGAKEKALLTALAWCPAGMVKALHLLKRWLR